MNTIILASHGELSQGLKQTAEMILGPADNIYALSAYRDEDEPIEGQMQQLVTKLGTKNLFILTDILGGSVNNEMLPLLKDNPEIHLITGMNLPLVISIATQAGKISSNDLQRIIIESQNSLIDCSRLLQTSEKGGDDL
ncbi:PTS fructose transporter subunit IIA [Enterococcus sp. MJM12]|uniref:PTS fructose transporter subunit IIA n=1 Tax=Candidatus Enterococcus myersii TaxID=2815322 RepID=A0ABS3H975_9ENTE|nr:MULTISPECIES: PTS fructose transporter subunit IIA [unclassified Enterococcus]MBO0450010.1 PTS fructose transporter subunit IIA [Enterococcus sp. MJM12]